MSLRHLSVRLILVSLVLLPLMSISGTVSAHAAIDADIAASDAITISRLESAGDAEKLYEWMHPDAKYVVPESVVVGWYTNDFFPLQPQPISEIISVNIVDWVWPVTGKLYANTAEITFVQPFGTGDNVTYQQEIVRLVRDGSRWKWFFGRSPEFVESQIARFPAMQSNSVTPSQSTTSRGTSSRSLGDISSTQTPRGAGCTLVELYPGYPAYRGVITGMLAKWAGLGDWACLEALVVLDPSFDMAQEDAANISAARELGINGQPKDWVWENWMQIEAVRGLPAQCYSCILMSSDLVPLTTSVQPAPSDPRILVGLWFEATSYGRRAQAFYVSENQSPNAQELLVLYQQLEQHFNQPGASYPTFEDMQRQLVQYGGYTWVPDDAWAQDQEFLAIHAWLIPDAFYPQMLLDLYYRQMESAIRDWRLHGNGSSLRQYLADFFSE